MLGSFDPNPMYRNAPQNIRDGVLLSAVLQFLARDAEEVRHRQPLSGWAISAVHARESSRQRAHSASASLPFGSRVHGHAEPERFLYQRHVAIRIHSGNSKLYVIS